MNYEKNESYSTCTLAKELATEFEKKFDFQERLSRVDLTQINHIVNEFKLNQDLCKVIYILELENKLTPLQSYNYLTWIMKIYEETGNHIPETPTYIFKFAAREGAWLQFLYGKFKYAIEDKLRPLINTELSIDFKESTPVERISDLLNSRCNLINYYIIPLIDRWIIEHDNLNQSYAAAALLSPIIKTDPSEAYKKLIEAVNSAKDFFFTLDILTEKKDLEEDVKIKLQIIETRRSLLKPLKEMPSTTLAQVLLQAIPRIKPELTTPPSSNILIVHAPVTRNGLVGPDFKSPIDFLERDILLAKKRPELERCDFLSKTVTKVFKNLNYQIPNQLEAAYTIVKEVLERFNHHPPSRKQFIRIIYKEAGKQILENNLSKISEKELYEYLNCKRPIPREQIIEKISEYFMKKLGLEKSW
ncbi:MAG: hypothetical protein OdinLCB4_001150 [Candidatus Odinarchaeum yellowstonii]|uniref:Uncharacterized protein n=1 Tax=Odinarchaeota yellowstonii (strain LCB_4) TaxID=1841599 RepID=A0AAF0D2M3_ODILC|nr:MAG: hypothetical protein OdinLCB4_001150 [Candidatus Odinarchaeum yellowstonii]